MEDNISKIKERVDVVDLVGSYIKLQKSGVNYKARCPFHNEKSPSFYVSPERQIWHCFGCSLGGDVFGFIKQIEGVEFPEALRILAARAGVQLSHFKPDEQSNKSQLYDVCELATKFFQKQLEGSGTGKLALQYLRDRGVTDESIKKFRLGYAPDSWQGLGDFLTRSFRAQDVLDAGLLVRREGGSGQYDRFRSRIMFPIFDLNNAVVGFAGRIFNPPGVMPPAEEGAKYVNTPQTAIYDKGKLLYGLNFAKLDMRRKNKCLVVEGNVDVIMSHQVGATTAVASSGTALTDGHLRIIKRYTDNLDLCFDADSAGTIATDRGVDLALAHGLNVGVVAISEPGVKDPADYVLKHGAAWAEYSSQSKPFLEFYFNKFRTTLDLASALGKKMFTQKLLPFVAAMGSKIEQAHWVNEIATAVRMDEGVIRTEIASIKPRAEIKPEQDAAVVATTPEPQPLSLYEETLLALMLKRPSLVNAITLERETYLSKQMKDYLALMRPVLALATDPQQARDKIMAGLSAHAVPNVNSPAETAFIQSDEFWNDFKDKDFDEECEKLLNQIKKRIITTRLESLQLDIKAVEREGDAQKLGSLITEFVNLTKELATSA